LVTLALNVIFNFIFSITEKEDGYISAFLGWFIAFVYGILYFTMNCYFYKIYILTFDVVCGKLNKIIKIKEK